MMSSRARDIMQNAIERGLPAADFEEDSDMVDFM